MGVLNNITFGTLASNGFIVNMHQILWPETGRMPEALMRLTESLDAPGVDGSRTRLRNLNWAKARMVFLTGYDNRQDAVDDADLIASLAGQYVSMSISLPPANTRQYSAVLLEEVKAKALAGSLNGTDTNYSPTNQILMVDMVIRLAAAAAT